MGISHAQQDTDQKILSGYSMMTRTSLLSVVSACATCAVERTLAWRTRTDRSLALPDCTT
ncbi:hypothetical protein D3C79_972610 [compost metagenome]